MITDGLNLPGSAGSNQEFWFNTFYRILLTLSFFKDKENGQDEIAEDTAEEALTCRLEWLDQAEDGGFAEGVVRIMVAVAHADVIL
ncbi:MAG: hypothetical protein R2861_05540 [Desulfobacterales bacterium]